MNVVRAAAVYLVVDAMPSCVYGYEKSPRLNTGSFLDLFRNRKKGHDDSSRKKYVRVIQLGKKERKCGCVHVACRHFVIQSSVFFFTSRDTDYPKTTPTLQSSNPVELSKVSFPHIFITLVSLP